MRGERSPAGEIWENAPPPPNKDYTAYATQGQHHLHRCTGYDPARTDPKKRESRAVRNPATVYNSQEDMQKRQATSREYNMHDVYMNKTGMQPAVRFDTGRDNYAHGGCNPKRHDAHLKDYLEPTWRNRQRATRPMRSDPISAPRVDAMRTRKKDDSHRKLERMPTGSSEGVVNLRVHEAIPVVSCDDRPVGAFSSVRTPPTRAQRSARR